MNDKVIQKIKIRKKDGKLKVKLKVDSNYTLNIKQCDLLDKKSYYGFFKLNYSKKNKLEYTGPQGISLYSRLNRPISEYDFFFLIEQIVDIVKRLRQLGLSWGNLVLDSKYVFFNEPTKELVFLYVPVITPHGSADILDFIEQIVYSVCLENVDSMYLSDFSYFIKKMDYFDAEKIELYIYQLNHKIVDLIKGDKIRNGKYSEVSALEQKIYKSETSVNTGEQQSGDDDLTDIILQDMEAFKTQYEKNEDATVILEDENTVLLEQSAELFEKKAEDDSKYPTLIRVVTEEEIKVNKLVFRIGKDENCVDYVVMNNGAVSRSHADIIIRDGRYYVFDLRSKNKTFINNRVLPTEHEIEIFDGDILKLANEEFLFRV